MTGIVWKSLAIEKSTVETIYLLANAKTGNVAVGYFEWTDRIGAPPRCVAFDQTGFGKFKPTHFAALPSPPDQEQQS